jgi:hypothetical protein
LIPLVGSRGAIVLGVVLALGAATRAHTLRGANDKTCNGIRQSETSRSGRLSGRQEFLERDIVKVEVYGSSTASAGSIKVITGGV